MINKLKVFLPVFILALLIYGCSSNIEADYEFHRSCIKVNEDGSIILTMKDVFDKDYYNESELVDMVNQEIYAFNSENGSDKIKLGNHSVNGQDVMLELIFADIDAYNKYNPNENLYLGTISGAINEGYDLNRSLSVAGKSGSTIGKNDLNNMKDNNVIIIKTPYSVQTPGKVTYYSQGMEYINNNEVAVSTNGVYFIMYK